MKKVYVFAAQGQEEIEALTPIDILRRAGMEVVICAVGGSLEIKGSHGIIYQADIKIEDADLTDADALILPGGMPGTLNLKADKTLEAALLSAVGSSTYLCAICAAPRVFGELGLLKGKTACCYPGIEGYLEGAVTTENPVECSGQFITSRGMGTAIPFSLKIVEMLAGKDAAENMSKNIVFTK